MACNCDYSYTCNECLNKFELENQRDYTEELQDWVVKCLAEVAKQFNVQLPPPPQKRSKYRY